MKTENTMAMVLAAAVGALCSYCAQLVVPLGGAGGGDAGGLYHRHGQGVERGRALFPHRGEGHRKKGGLSDGGGRGRRGGLAHPATGWPAGIEVQFSFLIAAMVIIWLIVNELISILENVAAMGGPVPSFLSKLLARLKNVVEKKAEDEQHGDT